MHFLFNTVKQTLLVIPQTTVNPKTYSRKTTAAYVGTEF